METTQNDATPGGQSPMWVRVASKVGFVALVLGFIGLVITNRGALGMDVFTATFLFGTACALAVGLHSLGYHRRL